MRRSWRLWGSRVLGGAVGLVLLTAGILKAIDMELFVRQLRDYGIVSDHTVLILIAWALIAVECVLGIGLLVLYRPGIVFSFTALLLLVFLGVTSWAWLAGSTEDCGCFGAWMKRTPRDAVFEDLVLLAATGLAWAGCRNIDTTRSRARGWAVIVAFLAGIVLPVASGLPVPRIQDPGSGSIGIGLDRLRIPGLEHIDLNYGDYLLMLTDTECEHCQEAVPEFNALAEQGDMPYMIALSPNTESERLRFIEELQPAFPVGPVNKDIFWHMLGDGDIPRTLLVRDGEVLETWDKRVPDQQSIREKLGY